MKRNSIYKILYTVFEGDEDSGKGYSFSTTNKRVLSEETNISYGILVRVFTRERRSFFRRGSFLIIKSELLLKQRKYSENLKF